MFTLVTTSRFDRRLARFVRTHPQLKRRLAQTFRDLEADPFQSHLRLHSLKGELAGLQSVSLTYRYRIILTVTIAEGTVVLLDIGTHDEVYRP